MGRGIYDSNVDVVFINDNGDDNYDGNGNIVLIPLMLSTMMIMTTLTMQ